VFKKTRAGRVGSTAGEVVGEPNEKRPVSGGDAVPRQVELQETGGERGKKDSMTWTVLLDSMQNSCTNVQTESRRVVCFRGGLNSQRGKARTSNRKISIKVNGGMEGRNPLRKEVYKG